MGGETVSTSETAPVRAGLSPRGRGNLLLPRSSDAGQWSIPAWAGKPVGALVIHSTPAVYPRVGGETPRRPPGRPTGSGLSPRGRGNPQPRRGDLAAVRSIPAWAGKPENAGSVRVGPQVYPRVGGETSASASPVAGY